MKIKSILAGAVMVFGLTSGVSAQGIKLQELRLNVADVNLSNGTSINLNFPSSASAGFFFNDKVALEPTVGIYAEEDYNFLSVGAALAYYVNGDHGKAGLFVAPNLNLLKSKGTDSQVNYGADVGYKIAMRDNLSARVAGTVRDGDFYDDPAFGVSLGFSFYINK